MCLMHICTCTKYVYYMYSVYIWVYLCSHVYMHKHTTCSFFLYPFSISASSPFCLLRTLIP